MKTMDVCALTGATYRQLDHWTRKGFVGPSIVPTKGTGHCREWSTEDAVRVAVMVQLIEAGMEPVFAAGFVDDNSVSYFRAKRVGPIRVEVDVQSIRDGLTARRDLAS